MAASSLGYWPNMCHLTTADMQMDIKFLSSYTAVVYRTVTWPRSTIIAVNGSQMAADKILPHTHLTLRAFQDQPVLAFG